MTELIGEFYRRVAPIEARQLERGQVCWGPISYLSSRLQHIDLGSYNPQDESRNRYSISSSDPDVPSTLFDHQPVHELRLQNDEALLVNKAKLRPVVVMSQRNEYWPLGGARLAERGLLCLPMYSFHPNDSSEFRQRIQAQEYPWWLYLPENSQFREGFARLDRLQTIEESHLRSTQQALTEDALWFVSEWLRYYLTEEIDPMFLEHRRELVQNLP